MARKIIVVGGGPAGVFAALEAKRVDPAAVVTLVSEERFEPYERPPLSKAVLLGTAKAEDTLIAGPGGFAQRGIALKLGTRCVAIDPDARIVNTTDGSLPYDSLVLATGSRMRELPDLPFGGQNVHYLRTADDAIRFKSELSPGSHLLIIGAGLIGLEAAASAAALGVRITVIEAASSLMARTCDRVTAARIAAEHEKHGINFELSTSVIRSSKQPDGTLLVETSNGKTFSAQAILVAIGVKPDDTLAVTASIAVDDGILVDAECRTSIPNIFAAGDATRLVGPGFSERQENWRHAQDQGAVAGRNAAGAAEKYVPLPSYWSEQYDLYIQGIGRPAQNVQNVIRTISESGAISFEVKDGIIEHAIGINAQRDMAAVRRLIERRVKVDLTALKDTKRPLNALLKAAAPAS